MVQESFLDWPREADSAEGWVKVYWELDPEEKKQKWNEWMNDSIHPFKSWFGRKDTLEIMTTVQIDSQINQFYRFQFGCYTIVSSKLLRLNRLKAQNYLHPKLISLDQCFKGSLWRTQLSDASWLNHTTIALKLPVQQARKVKKNRVQAMMERSDSCESLVGLLQFALKTPGEQRSRLLCKTACYSLAASWSYQWHFPRLGVA